MSKDTWEHDDSNRTSSVCVSRDGNYVASLGSNGVLHYYKKTSSTPIWSWTGANTTYGNAAMAMSDDGQRVAIAGSNDLYVFGPTNNTPIWTTDGGTYDSWFNAMYNVAISGDGNYVAAFSNLSNSGGIADNIILFDGDGNFKWTSSPRASGQPLGSLNLSQDGKYLAAGFNNSTSDNTSPQVVFWDTSSSTPLWAWTTKNSINAKAVRNIAISRYGDYIAAPLKRTGRTYLGLDKENSQLMFFSKDSATPLWTYIVQAYGSRILCDISDDGRYILLGTGEQGYVADATPTYEDANRLILLDSQSSTSVGTTYDSAAVPGGVYTTLTPIWKSPQYASDIIGVSIKGNADYFTANITDDGIDVYDFVDKTSDPSVVFNNATGDWYDDVDWINNGRYGQSSSGDTQQCGPVKISKGGNSYVVAGAGGNNDKVMFYDYNPIIKDSSQIGFSNMADNLSTATNHLTLSGNAIGAVTKWGYYFLD
jgi:hypothetical protein